MKRVNNFSISNKLPAILLATFMMSITAIIGKLLEVHLFIIIAFAAAAYFASLTFSGGSIIHELRGIAKRA